MNTNIYKKLFREFNSVKFLCLEEIGKKEYQVTFDITFNHHTFVFYSFLENRILEYDSKDNNNWDDYVVGAIMP